MNGLSIITIGGMLNILSALVILYYGYHSEYNGETSTMLVPSVIISFITGLILLFVGLGI